MSKIKIYLASIIGEILEWYDFSLYSFLGSIFATLFFPEGSFLTGIIGVFTIFAIGFMSRPLGGFIFGRIADRAGRKAAFFISLVTMAIATFLIGCLPTYQQVGFVAPILLLILRLLQGFSCGGEFSISMIFLSEHATKNNYYFSGSLTWMATMLGSLIASLTILCLSSHHDFFMTFAWRIPFFIGGVIALLGLYLRLNVAETPVYLEFKKKHKAKASGGHFIKKHKRPMINIFLLNAPLAALSYVGVAFLPTYFSKFVELSLSKTFLINTILIVSLILLIPLCGYLADKWQGRKIYLCSIVLLISLSFPAYYLFAYGDSCIEYAVAILFMAISGAMIKSVTPGLSVAFAPLEDRAVIMSFSYNITYCLIGGMAPLLMSYLIGKTHFLLMPAVYIVFFAALSLICFIQRCLKNTVVKPIQVF